MAIRHTPQELMNAKIPVVALFANLKFICDKQTKKWSNIKSLDNIESNKVKQYSKDLKLYQKYVNLMAAKNGAVINFLQINLELKLDKPARESILELIGN